MKRNPTLAPRVALLAACAGALGAAGVTWAGDVLVMLSGAAEVPAVTTSARGSGSFSVGADHSISGSVTVTGTDATMAHIHEGAPGKNGPPVVSLDKTTGGKWSVPAGAKLSEAQYQSFLAGNLYINVHSDAHKGGEIRGQLKP